MAGRLPELRRTMRNVRVERQKGARAAKLDLVIPDRRMTGEVVDESSTRWPERWSGQPTSSASTSSRPGAINGVHCPRRVPERPHNAWAEAERDGHLRLGSGHRHAVQGGGEPWHPSGAARKEMARGRGDRAGRACRRRPPFATPRGRLNVLLSDATSDESGRFRLDVPAAADELQIEVMPPGFALRTLSVQAPFPDPLSIAVDDAGGSLVLRTPALDLGNPLQATPLIVVGGQPLSLDTLLSWARMSGESQRDPRRYEIPRLAAGDYSACLLTLPGQIQVILGLAALTGKSCDHGTLAPHGELVLDLGGAK